MSPFRTVYVIPPSRVIDSVFQQYYPTFVEHSMTRQLQLHLGGRGREQWYPAAEEHRDDCELDRVYESQFEEAAKKRSATEKPDVLARGFSESG